VSVDFKEDEAVAFSATMGRENQRCCDAVLVRIGTVLAK
jgi:hypothetical protein